MAYPEFRWRFTPGFTRVAPPVLPITVRPQLIFGLVAYSLEDDDRSSS
jgi:hypothetical protein